MSDTPRTNRTFDRVYNTPAYAADIVKAEMGQLELELAEVQKRASEYMDQLQHWQVQCLKWTACAEELARSARNIGWTSCEEGAVIKQAEAALAKFDALKKGTK